MESYLYPDHFDLVTPDGMVTHMTPLSEDRAQATVLIEHISPAFVGFQIDTELVFFNIKSTLAQLGLNGVGIDYDLNLQGSSAEVLVELRAIGYLAKLALKSLNRGSLVGKLFAADDRRRVRRPMYLSRMFGRVDGKGRPLLSLGSLQASEDLILDRVEGRCVAYLSLQDGCIDYDEDIASFFPTLGRALMKNLPMRRLLHLHQQWHPHLARNVADGELLLVKTLPLHIRTVFARVVPELLAPGYEHTTASILQPDTYESGDIYELFGNSKREISDIPLEFYTLEPHREHVFFQDRDQLQTCLENTQCLFKAFQSAPGPEEHRASVFVVKGEQILNLQASDWVVRDPKSQEFPGLRQTDLQAAMVERYIEQQASYPFLKAMEDELITSQGILLERYFPSPLMKRMLLGTHVQRCLKAIYFLKPSRSNASFFSQEDRSLLHDLAKFGIPVYWVDEATERILQYAQKPGREVGIFVRPDQVSEFINSTVFGIYGSNLLEGDFDDELMQLLAGIKELRKSTDHPLLGPSTPLALMTGGGPGLMEVGNRVAKTLNILSCGNIVDFSRGQKATINEQKQNPHVEAKMTYRLDQLVERQADFHLDFPIFLTGGVGTDFEFSLEEVRRKVGSVPPLPIILFGDSNYWASKITSRFRCNLTTGTINGSEWLSNCFFCVKTAKQALEVYKRFFQGELAIGPKGPVMDAGFVDLTENASELSCLLV